MADTLNDLIINGAYAAAPIVDDSYSVDDLVGAGLADKKRKIKERSEKFKAQRAEQAENLQAAEDFLAEDSRRFESTGSFVEQERYPDPFGIERSAAEPGDQRSDKSLEGYEKQRGGYVIVDRGRGKERVWRERGQLVSEPQFAKNKQPDYPNLKHSEITTAPQGAGMGGPNGLATQLADMVARGEVDPEAFVPGSSTKTIDALINEMALEADPQLRVEADKEIGRQAAKRENERYSPAVRAINNVIAQRKAEWMPQVSPAAQVNLAGIGDIQNLGIASKKFNRGSNMSIFSVVPNADGDVMDRDGGIDQMAAYVTEIGEDLPEGRVPQMPGTDTGYSITRGGDLGSAIRMVGPDGLTVGYVDNQDRFIADVNISGADNISNAPVSRTATWLEANLPDYGREQGTSFGARQVNPGNELRILNERLGKFGLATGIRGIDDLEQVVRSYVVDAAFSGRGMFKPDPENRQKQLFVRDPGIDEVLGELDYTPDEKQKLAAALQTVEAARRSPVNELQKKLFAAGIPSNAQTTRQVRNLIPVAGSVYDGVTGTESNYDYYESQYRSEPKVSTGFNNDVQLSRIKDERFGRDNKKTGEKRKSVKGALKLLDASPEQVFAKRDPSTIYATTPGGQQVLLPDAQQDLLDARLAQNDAPKPFQAGIEGEPVERARFITNTERNPNVAGMTNEERIKAFGPKGGEAANEIIRREIEDKQLRAAAAKQQDPIAAEFRVRDDKYAAEGEARRRQDSYNEKIRLRGNYPLGQGIPQLYIEEGFSSNAPYLDLYKSQQATSAAVNPPTDPIPLAARGGWMGGPGTGEVRSPWSSSSIQREIAPDPWSQPVGTDNGISQEVSKRSTVRNQKALPYGISTSGPKHGPVPFSARKQFTDAAKYFVKSPRYTEVNRYGRRAAYGGAAVAGLAGLNALIGEERDNREQEMYR